MREGVTLKLDSGEQIRVDVDTDELAEDEIVARRHPAGTTDRWLAADRDR